jgi:hypothetical protein
MRELKSAIFFNNKLDRGAHMNFTINWSLSVHLDTICLVTFHSSERLKNEY